MALPESGHNNTYALTHGLYSARVRTPLEEKFADALRSAMADLGQVYSARLDEHAIRRCARSLTTVHMVETRIDAEGVDSLSDRVFRDYEQAVKMVGYWLDKLGMTRAEPPWV